MSAVHRTRSVHPDGRTARGVDEIGSGLARIATRDELVASPALSGSWRTQTVSFQQPKPSASSQTRCPDHDHGALRRRRLAGRLSEPAGGQRPARAGGLMSLAAQQFSVHQRHRRRRGCQGDFGSGEGGANSDGDRHVLVVDTGTCKLYELYDAHPNANGSWQAGSGAVYDLVSDQLRPRGWTSADAAGLPITPGLLRYEEVAAGHVDHAIRVTVPRTQQAFLWPARHAASDSTDTSLSPMGLRWARCVAATSRRSTVVG
jgi:hypothetical protein